jgi:hypothetical protein
MRKALLLCALPLLAACTAKSEAKRDPVPATASTAATPAAAGRTDAAMAEAHGGGALAPAPSERVTGTVLETLDSGGFTYVRFHTAKGERWAAVGRVELPRGATITIAPTTIADRFVSQPLGKTFDNLIFGALEEVAPSAGSASSAPLSPHGAESAPAATGVVAKAEGKAAKTVAELWARGPSLRDGQPVVVRGRVVKVLRGIMNRNWIHLRDGSGTPGKDDEITVTSQDAPTIGSVVTATGTLHLNRDFGSGYSFPVLIEEASVK